MLPGAACFTIPPDMVVGIASTGIKRFHFMGHSMGIRPFCEALGMLEVTPASFYSPIPELPMSATIGSFLALVCSQRLRALVAET